MILRSNPHFHLPPVIDVHSGKVLIAEITEMTAVSVSLLLASCVCAEFTSPTKTGKTVAYTHCVYSGSCKKEDADVLREGVYHEKQGRNTFTRYASDILRYVEDSVRFVLQQGFSSVPRSSIRTRIFGGNSVDNPTSVGFLNYQSLRHVLEQERVYISTDTNGLNRGYSQKFLFQPFSGSYRAQQIKLPDIFS
jgi:hypothetical protein